MRNIEQVLKQSRALWKQRWEAILVVIVLVPIYCIEATTPR